MAPSRFNSARAPCGEGFFHPSGGSGFRHFKDLCVSRSRLPALSLEDASHSWSADDPSQHLYAFDLAPPKISTRTQRGQEWQAKGATRDPWTPTGGQMAQQSRQRRARGSRELQRRHGKEPQGTPGGSQKLEKGDRKRNIKTRQQMEGPRNEKCGWQVLRSWPRRGLTQRAQSKHASRLQAARARNDQSDG